MKDWEYAPEELMPNQFPFTIEQLQRGVQTKEVFCAVATRCNAAHDLIVPLGCATGIIRREEAAIGIDSGNVKDIAVLSRVGRKLCFHVLYVEERTGMALLSRRSAQEEALRRLMHGSRPGDVLPAVVTHLEPFGAFVDIGRGNASLINIENISVSRISHPSDRFSVGQHVRVVIRSVEPESRRICVSHKELLGTWHENADEFEEGETVTGIVRSVMDYGVFVELTPNLAGLSEPKEGVRPGQPVSVFIKSVLPQRMKVKMLILNVLESPPSCPVMRYFITEGHISHWRYSAPECEDKRIETVFDSEKNGTEELQT